MKYKQGRKEASGSLYSTLPETLETLHAKEASELQSEVNPQHAYSPTHTHRADLQVCGCVPAEVQGGSEEQSCLQSVPPAARDPGDGPRQGSLRAAQRGSVRDGVGPQRTSSLLFSRRHLAAGLFSPGEV